MKKVSIKVGASHQPADINDRRTGKMSGILFALGVLAICTVLILPMRGKDDPLPEQDAVAVMKLESGENTEREKLAEPEQITSTEPEWSIFEYIGELIAGLLTRD